MSKLQPRRYFPAAQAVRLKLVPFAYVKFLQLIKRGEIQTKKVGNTYYLCVEWINDYFERKE